MRWLPGGNEQLHVDARGGSELLQFAACEDALALLSITFERREKVFEARIGRLQAIARDQRLSRGREIRASAEEQRLSLQVRDDNGIIRDVMKGVVARAEFAEEQMRASQRQVDDLDHNVKRMCGEVVGMRQQRDAALKQASAAAFKVKVLEERLALVNDIIADALKKGEVPEGGSGGGRPDDETAH